MGISEIKNEESSMYTIGVNADGKTEMFCNRDDKYVFSQGYSILFRGTYNEAVNARKSYINRNSAYCVIERADGKLILRRHEGVITYVPINTQGVFKRRRDAKKFMTSKNSQKKMMAEKIETVKKTA